MQKIKGLIPRKYHQICLNPAPGRSAGADDPFAGTDELP